MYHCSCVLMFPQKHAHIVHIPHQQNEGEYLSAAKSYFKKKGSGVLFKFMCSYVQLLIYVIVPSKAYTPTPHHPNNRTRRVPSNRQKLFPKQLRVQSPVFYNKKNICTYIQLIIYVNAPSTACTHPPRHYQPQNEGETLFNNKKSIL